MKARIKVMYDGNEYIGQAWDTMKTDLGGAGEVIMQRYVDDSNGHDFMRIPLTNGAVLLLPTEAARLASFIVCPCQRSDE